jgi:hypothetical protein
MALERALEAEDAAVAAPDAEAVHDLGHELSNMVYAMLARQAGTTAPDNH